MEDLDKMINEEQMIPQIIRVEETVSTNSLIRELIFKENLPEGSVVLADFQTAGRGQIGNVWESEAGKNLTFSLVIYPTSVPVNQQFLISQIAALSVKEALDQFVDDVTVKWPNDIYWKDRKICGMLIENDLSGRSIASSIIGIGLNINQAEFKGDAPNPVSLIQILGAETDREEVLRRFLALFYESYLALLRGEDKMIRTKYAAALYRKSGFYSYKDKNGTFEAEIAGIEPTGHLLLRLQDGTVRRYAFKEVAYVHEAILF